MKKNLPVTSISFLKNYRVSWESTRVHKPVFTYIKYTPEDVIEYVSSFAKEV